jgi:two-component system, NarL family, response regulator DevR
MSIRVFLVDDHELVRTGTRSVLDAEPDIDVVGESGSARGAAGRILALRPDVALVDVRLGDGSGIDVCRAVTARDATVRTVVLTAFEDDAAVSEARAAGAVGFVLKSVHADEIVAMVRAAATDDDPRLFPVPRSPRPARTGGGATSPGDRLAGLTRQELKVLALVGEGLSNREIGERLGLTCKTAKNYVSNVLAKLGLHRRTQAAVLFATAGVSVPDVTVDLRPPAPSRLLA